MGLSVSVGLLIDLREEDEEGFAYFRDQFALLNQALDAAHLGRHEEPTETAPDVPWSEEMWGYSGLHYLRRIAAHLWAGRALPEPGDADASRDPVLEEYFRRLGEPPAPTILQRILGRAAARRPRFDHLVLHSDAEGFYVPLDFEKVVFPDERLKIAGAMIGSAPRLLEECRRLAGALGIPESLSANDGEVFEAAENQGKGEGWKRYGIETFTCLRLIEACRLSVKSGCALVFC